MNSMAICMDTKKAEDDKSNRKIYPMADVFKIKVWGEITMGCVLVFVFVFVIVFVFVFVSVFVFVFVFL